jgi:hypothetical protein
MNVNGMAIRALFGYLLCCGVSWESKADDSEDSIQLEFEITSVKPIDRAYLKAQAQQDDSRLECPVVPAEKPPPVTSTTSNGIYRCKIEKFHEVVSSITTYELYIEGPDIDPKPIGIRVNPATPKSTVIALKLTDSVFLKSWSPGGYYRTFFSTTDQENDRDLTAYLITKNYYFKKRRGKDDNETFSVLKRWLERALVTAAEPKNSIIYQAVDNDVIDELERLLKDDGNGKSIIDNIASEAEKRNVQNEMAKLKIGDFVLFRNPPAWSQSDIKLRQPHFCKLYAALKSMWEDTKNQPTTYQEKPNSDKLITHKLVSDTFAFGEKNLFKEPYVPFKQCLSPAGAS